MHLLIVRSQELTESFTFALVTVLCFTVQLPVMWWPSDQVLTDVQLTQKRLGFPLIRSGDILELFRFLRGKKPLCLHPPMKQLLLLFACFSLTVCLVSADCDEIHTSQGPTGASRDNIEVYYRDVGHHRKFILINRNPYWVRVDLQILKVTRN